MKYYAALLAIALIIIIAGTKLDYINANASQAGIETDYAQADLKNGAQLYDNWLKITDAKPEGNNPLYPPEAKKSGKSSWRCKECHGWDYIGNKGRYGKGSHYTGISGVFHVQLTGPDVLYSSLTSTDTKHNFSDYLTKSQLWNLVKFLREGQAAIDPVIDEQGQAKGDTVQGRALYEKYCSSCHGTDGNEIDFKSKKEGIQGVGWLDNDNPQESIHKIRWGHPGSDMPSMIIDKELSEQEAIDILTYSQLLGRK